MAKDRQRHTSAWFPRMTHPGPLPYPERDTNAFLEGIPPGRERTSIKRAQEPEALHCKRARPGSMDLCK